MYALGTKICHILYHMPQATGRLTLEEQQALNNAANKNAKAAAKLAAKTAAISQHSKLKKLFVLSEFFSCLVGGLIGGFIIQGPMAQWAYVGIGVLVGMVFAALFTFGTWVQLQFKAWGYGHLPPIVLVLLMVILYIVHLVLNADSPITPRS